MWLIDYYKNNKNKSLLMIHGLFFLVTVCCFGYFDYFLLSDYPNYLARINLYNHLSDSHILSEYYYKDMKITPYMAFPVIVGFLEPITGIYWAGKIFIIFALFVILSGGLFLNYTLYNRITPFSLFIHIFMFNFTLSMGFMNFTLGLGLILWGYGLWIKYYNHNVKFYILFAIYAIPVFLTHIFSLFLLALVVGLYQLTLSPKSTIKDFLKSSFYAGLKVLTFTIIPMIITPLVAITDMGFPSITKYVSIIFHLVYIWIAPIKFGSFFSSFLVLSIFTLLILFKKINFKLPFLMIGLLLISSCVPWLLTGVEFVNIRIPVFLGLLFTVSATFKGKDEHIAFCATIISVFSLFLYVSNIQTLYHHNNYVTEFVETVKDDYALKGKRLLNINDNNVIPPYGEKNNLLHLSSYATIVADMFVPQLFTGIPPISTYNKYNSIDAKMGTWVNSDQLRLSHIEAKKYVHPLEAETGYPYHFYWKNWRQDFDFVFWIHFGDKPTDIPSELSAYKKGSFFTIYKINKKNKG